MGVTGTTTPMFIARQSQRGAVEAGKSYFDVRIAAAQAYFDGRLWERAKQLIVTSRVTLNHPTFGAEPINAIQRSRPIRRGATESLGLSSNLIQLVPATMTRVSVSVEFLVDKENRLAALGGLINDDAFLAAVSLAPGAALVAKTIAALSQKVIQSVFSAEERQPLLQFNGDFNLADGSLRDGYYAIVATQDEEHPLPDRSTLRFEHDQLLAGSTPVEQLSYVVLDVRRVDRRGRDLNEGAEWDRKLRAAEAIAEGVQLELDVDGPARAGYWKECKPWRTRVSGCAGRPRNSSESCGIAGPFPRCAGPSAVQTRGCREPPRWRSGSDGGESALVTAPRDSRPCHQRARTARRRVRRSAPFEACGPLALVAAHRRPAGPRIEKNRPRAASGAHGVAATFADPRP